MLQLFEEPTKEACGNDADLSFAIPGVNALQKYLSKSWKDNGVKTIKEE